MESISAPPSGAPGGATRLSPADRRLAQLTLAGAIAYLAWSALTRQPQEAIDAVVNGVFGLVGPGLALLLWRTGLAYPRGSRDRRGWQLLALAFLANALGDIIAGWYEARGLEPWVSWADLFYLLYPPLTLAGVLLFPLGLRGARDRMRFLLDAAIGTIGCVMLSWEFVLYPILAAGDQGPAELALAVAYPLLGYLNLLGAITLALRVPPRGRRGPRIFLAAGFALLFLADTGWSHLSLLGTFTNGGPIDAAYMLGYLLVALAALHERSAQRAGAPSVGRDVREFSIIPYGSALLGYGLLLIAAFDGGSGVLIGLVLGAVTLTGLVLARQVLMIRENMALAADQAAERLRVRLSALIQYASDVILLLTPGGTVTFASPSARAVLGWEPAALVGRSYEALLDPEDAETARQFVLGVLGHAGPLAGVTWKARHQDGSRTWLEVVGTDLTHEPTVGGIVLNLRDVTERNALEQQLVHQAFHDPLTGLANRALFKDRVDHGVDLARRAGERVAILFLDLDHFKTINDSLGHAHGDALLQEVGRRLRDELRDTDTVARLGGDEFAILVEDVQGEAQLAGLADRLVAALARPLVMDDQALAVSASIGIALGRGGDTRAELMRNADLAMYEAKSRGRGGYAFFEPGMHDRAREQLELQADLRDAIEGTGLVLEYQPIVELASGEVVGAEALLRWDHPTRGRLPPAAFLPLAEETGLIGPLGAWVIRTATREAAQWPATPEGLLPHVAVNVSPRELGGELAAHVRQSLEAAGLAPARLTIEVTETWLMEHLQAAVVALGELRGLGVRVSMDDFGTGHSSLARLTELPLDTLKIPKPFVDRLGGAEAAEGGLAGAILGISRSLGLEVVAEGIEEARQVGMLLELGCRLGQGYHFGRPLPAARFRALLGGGRGAAAGIGRAAAPEAR